MPPQPVPGFTTAGEAANSAVRLLALQLALNATVSALKLTDGNLSSLMGARPSDAAPPWPSPPFSSQGRPPH